MLTKNKKFEINFTSFGAVYKDDPYDFWKCSGNNPGFIRCPEDVIDNKPNQIMNRRVLINAKAIHNLNNFKISDYHYFICFNFEDSIPLTEYKSSINIGDWFKVDGNLRNLKDLTLTFNATTDKLESISINVNYNGNPQYMIFYAGEKGIRETFPDLV